VDEARERDAILAKTPQEHIRDAARELTLPFHTAESGQLAAITHLLFAIAKSTLQQPAHPDNREGGRRGPAEG
jgi:hypothetical protein